MSTSSLIGLKGEASVKVTEENTALALGSGTVKVFGTPAMIALIEQAACVCLKGKLPDGKTSVGTDISVKHLKATPIGFTATAKVTIENAEKGDRLLTFKVEVFDSVEIIGKGTHQRFVVTEDKFFKAANSKVAPKI